VDAKLLRQLLGERVVVVTFTKVDGSERVMHCTTKPELIPLGHLPTGKLQVTEGVEEKVIRAYDVQVNGWRSFRVSSVKRARWARATAEGEEQEEWNEPLVTAQR